MNQQLVSSHRLQRDVNNVHYRPICVPATMNRCALFTVQKDTFVCGLFACTLRDSLCKLTLTHFIVFFTKRTIVLIHKVTVT